MTISFNSGVDPEEVKFNDQDMETVVLYNDQFPNGVTVWEKVVGVEYTLTSGVNPNTLYRGYNAFFVFYGSISPMPQPPTITGFQTYQNDQLILIGYITNSPLLLPNKIKHQGNIIDLNFVNTTGNDYTWSANRNTSLAIQGLYDSINIIGNNTIFEFIYP